MVVICMIEDKTTNGYKIIEIVRTLSEVNESV